MKKYFTLIYINLALLLVPMTAFATDLDDITRTLETPVVIITKVLLFACYVVGAILIFAAIAQYMNHRQSPKLVPLTTPVLLLVLGVGLLFIPYFTTLAKDSASAVEQQKKEGKANTGKSGLLGNGANRSGNSQLGPGSLPEDEYYDDTDNNGGSNGGGSGGGHWSDSY